MARRGSKAADVTAIPNAVRERLEQAQVDLADPRVIKAVGIALQSLEETPKTRKDKTGVDNTGSTLDLNIPGLKLKLSGSIVHILLSIGGLIGMLVTFADRFPAFKDALGQFFARFTNSGLFVPMAFAATSATGIEHVFAQRQIFSAAIYALLGATLLMCLSIILTSKDRNKIAFARDITKTLNGFFIGTATSLSI